MVAQNRFAFLLVLAFSVFIFQQASAAFTAPDISDISTPPAAAYSPIQEPQDVIGILNAVLVWVVRAFWIMAVIFIFYAAYIYLTAGGDPEMLKKAHKQLLWAVVAIAVALMAYGMPLLVGNILRSGYSFCVLGICV